MRILLLMAAEAIGGCGRKGLQRLHSRMAAGAIKRGMFSDQLKSELAVIKIFSSKTIHAIMTIQASGSIRLDMRLHKSRIHPAMAGLANSRIEFGNVGGMTRSAGERLAVGVFLVAGQRESHRVMREQRRVHHGQ